MAENGALQLDKINSAEIKRSRSGRACLPRLAFWAGERLFTSLNSNESPLYIPPKHEKSNASYITPTAGLQESIISSASHAEVTKSSKRTTRKQNCAPLKRLNSPNKHASNKAKQGQSKKKKTKSRSKTAVKTKISRLKSKKKLKSRGILTSSSEVDSQSDNLNHLWQSKKSKSAKKPILSDELASATEDRSPKRSNLYLSNGFHTSPSKNLDHTNNFNNLQSSKKKNVTWSDTEISSPFPKRNIFMTAISNARRLRSADSTVQKSALTNRQSNVVIDCPSVEDKQQKSTTASSDPCDDQNRVKPIRKKKVTQAKGQKHVGPPSPIKKKSARTTLKSNKKNESKPIPNGNIFKRKRKTGVENQKPPSAKSLVLKPTKNKNSTLLEISSSSESDENLDTPRRQRCPKRKRLSRVIIESTNSLTSNPVISENKSDHSKKIIVPPSIEEDSLLLGLFSHNFSNKPVLEEKTKKAITAKNNISKANSTSCCVYDQSPIPETVSYSEIEKQNADENIEGQDADENTEEQDADGNIEEQDADGNIEEQDADENIEEHDADESSEDNETSPHRFENQSKKNPAVSEKSISNGANKDIHKNERFEANVTQCCIADLFCDSPQPKGRRKTAYAISRFSKFADVGKNASKKHNKSLNSLQQDIDAEFSHVKRPAINPNMRIGDWHKRPFMKEIIDKKIPKAGTLKGKKWLQKQRDEMNKGYNDDYFADADSPNIKQLPKQLDSTKDSDLSLDFSTPKPKFPSDLYTRKLPTPEINESLPEFITTKKLNAYNHKRKKGKKKAMGSNKTQHENCANEKLDEEMASQSSTPPILTQENIKKAVQNINDMLSRLSAVKQPEADASYISSDELEDYYFNDP